MAATSKGTFWYENLNGFGIFSEPIPVSEYNYIDVSVCLGDLNGDFYPDVIMGSSGNLSRLRWSENSPKLYIIDHPSDVAVCPGTATFFSALAKYAFDYQWQADEGSGFYNLNDNSVYTGTDTDTLFISNSDISMNGYIYRCLVSNPKGNDISDTAVLIVEDNEMPVIISTHNDLIVGANENCEYILDDFTVDVISTDNCDKDLEISQIPIQGSLIFGDLNTVTINVSDNNGNFAAVNFNVQVKDITIPNIECVKNQTFVLSEGQSSILAQGTEFDPILVTDNCMINVINDYTNTSSLFDAEFQTGETKVIWTVTDLAGNINTCSFLINVLVSSDTILLIYPNPTHNKVFIKNENIKIDQISLFDVLGKPLFIKKEIMRNEEIDLSNFACGMYFLEIKTDKNLFTEKIIKN